MEKAPEFSEYTIKYGGSKMLDRQTVKEFLNEELEQIEVGADISIDKLVEVFCKYTEDDYYEWLKDNFRSFFNHGRPDWNWIKGMIEKYTTE